MKKAISLLDGLFRGYRFRQNVRRLHTHQPAAEGVRDTVRGTRRFRAETVNLHFFPM
jgi:hypothetical protein